MDKVIKNFSNINLYFSKIVLNLLQLDSKSKLFQNFSENLAKFLKNFQYGLQTFSKISSNSPIFPKLFVFLNLLLNFIQIFFKILWTSPKMFSKFEAQIPQLLSRIPDISYHIQ